MIRNHFNYLLPVAGLVALLGVNACELIAAVDRTKINPTTGAGGATGGGGTGGIDEGGGGMGGMGGSCNAASCPAGTDCQDPVCVDDACALQNKAEGTDCTIDTQAGTCDDAGMCIALACQDGMIGPGETDVDCGGPLCPPCAIDQMCEANSDCTSNNCDTSGANGICVPCVDGGCPAGTFCDANAVASTDQICQPEKAQGEACDGLTGECATGQCADGVCCDSACNGECEACDLAGSVGTCSAHPDGTDPENDCPADSCTGSSLTTSACMSGACAASQMTCPGGYECNAGGTACRTSCTSIAHCQTGFFCDTANNMCVAAKANGVACTGLAGECASGNCVDGVCCGTSTCPTCQICNLAGMEGSCQDVPLHQDPNGDCPGANDCCDGSGMCGTFTGMCQ